jgi:hypothetical protein
VVRQHSPLLLRISAVAAVVALLVIGWGVYQWGRHSVGVDYAEAVAQRKVLRDQLAKTRSDLDELRDRSARLETARRIDEQATKGVRKSLKDLQQENLDLREELQFYRAIVSPSLVKSGIRIENFKLDQGSEARHYHYKLTLIHMQEVKHRRQLGRGTVHIAVEGTQGGAPKRLSLADIGLPKNSGIRYSFKYFKHFEGDMILPKGFVPRTVVIRAVPRDGGTAHAVEETFDWPIPAS